MNNLSNLTRSSLSRLQLSKLTKLVLILTAFYSLLWVYFLSMSDQCQFYVVAANISLITLFAIFPNLFFNFNCTGLVLLLMGIIKSFDNNLSSSNEACLATTNIYFTKFSKWLFEGLFLAISSLTLLCLAKHMFSIVEEPSDENVKPEFTTFDLESYVLNSSDMENLPNKLQDLCPICFETFDEHNEVSIIKNCQHSYHKRCITFWFQKNLSCPMCRTKVGSIKESNPDLSTSRFL